MRIFTRALSLLVLLLLAASTQAQSDYTIPYQDRMIDLEENISSFSWSDLNRADRIRGGHYLWVQFYATPKLEVQERLAAGDVELINFIGNKAYLAYVPTKVDVDFLAQAGVRSITKITNDLKLSENLRYGNIGDWAIEDGRLRVNLLYHDKVSTEYALDQFRELKISIAQNYKGATTIELIIPDDCLTQLAELPFVSYIEVATAPDVKDDTDGRGLHRANSLDTQTEFGRNYDGSGIGVMVRDDGTVGPHIDYTGRIDNTSATETTGTHGDGVGGIMAGAGNLNPDYRGMAAGSDIYVIDYNSSFLDNATTSRINDGTVLITNSSYSNGCNDGYTSTTRTVDQQSNTLPNLLHVFSAGNSNNQDCGYGAGNQWGNITGGHKQGKNVIATANVFSDAGLVTSSSRGPAHDGRIKPDIAANGQNQISTDPNNAYAPFGGTSGAAPGIAGISAQLYQAYQETYDELPEGALIKAAMLNTANDYGNVGPDFRFGWGIVNALRAAELIEDGRFETGAASQGVLNAHEIELPEGTIQARVMLYWRDPAAVTGAAKALVNDLDLKLVAGPGVVDTLLPYVLDHTPNTTALNLPATNGEDHLNNVEQIVLNEPAAGTYTFDVSGFDVPQGNQGYFLVYEIITERITVTFPNGGEHLERGGSEFIHWDAVNSQGTFLIEYSRNNGMSWNGIAEVPANQRLYEWSLPFATSGEAIVRVTSENAMDVSDETFDMCGRVNNNTIELTSICLDSKTFTWNAVNGADSYDFYVLGEKYMEVRGTSTEPEITIDNLPAGEEVWVAVTASSSEDGWTTKRTVAVMFDGSITNCVLGNDLVVSEILSGAGSFSEACSSDADNLVRVMLTNNGMVDLTNFEVSYQLDEGPVVNEIFAGTLAVGESAEYVFTEPLIIENGGEYELTISTENDGDEFLPNNTATISFTLSTTLIDAPVAEDFELAGFPSLDWVLQNPDNDFSWVQASVTGADGLQTTAGYINNYDYNAAPEEDYVVTPVFRLGTNAMMSFDLAKAQFGADFSDAFRVDISSDCGATYSEIYYKEGLELSTLAGYNTTAQWAPAAAGDWRTESVDLADFENSNVSFRFVNINGYGNSTYLDNVNVVSDTISSVRQFQTLEDVELFPNPTRGELNLIVPSVGSQSVDLQLINSVGQTVSRQRAERNGGSYRLNVSTYPSGIYYLRISAGERFAIKKVIVE
ncbi:peptidase S8 [Lewinellaceae bacterium SD302]|nr:peptidase S8 [Lewinellaceae bacterium SD302]